MKMYSQKIYFSSFYLFTKFYWDVLIHQIFSEGIDSLCQIDTESSDELSIRERTRLNCTHRTSQYFFKNYCELCIKYTKPLGIRYSYFMQSTKRSIVSYRFYSTAKCSSITIENSRWYLLNLERVYETTERFI